MRRSRRNYYRILHLQPEAPPAVIKAAYRALMQTLRLHPDLGGDHEQAAMVNEAYAVLSDPVKRKAYDQAVLPIVRRARRTTGIFGAQRPTSRQDPAAPSQARSNAGVGGNGCIFCSEQRPPTIRRDSRCARCKSPLAPPPKLALGRELAGRRAAARAVKNHAVNVQLAWRGTICRAWLRDVSLTGLSLMVPVALEAQQVVRVFDPDFEALAVVIKCRREQSQYVIHARVATMIVKSAFGVFVRTAA